MRLQVPALVRYTVELSGPAQGEAGVRPTRRIVLYWYSRWVDFPSSVSIGSRPFYENAWAVLLIVMHIEGELVRSTDRVASGMSSPSEAGAMRACAPWCLIAY